MSYDSSALHSSLAEVWHLKSIKFNGREVRIITQNFNGPCSFIAICNILILRGDIEILPRTRENASYEFLSQLVAEYLLTASPDVDISAALSIMPYTQRGMDLNPVFTAADAFHPSGSASAGGELKLFAQANIPLLHGWLVDPAAAEAPVLRRVGDYDAAVALIAEVDHLTGGRFVVGERDQDSSALSTSPEARSPAREWTQEELQKVQDATTVRRFLDTTQSQLTYHGLFHLARALPPNEPCALFRNEHLCVLYRHSPGASGSGASGPAVAGPSSSSSSKFLQPSAPIASSSASYPHTDAEDNTTDQDPPTALYTLVTDHVFLHEPSVVWERLEDVDGGSAAFVDAAFVKASPAGGDFAGRTAEEMVRAVEVGGYGGGGAGGMQGYGWGAGAGVGAGEGGGDGGWGDPNDLALARQLQAEEDEVARRERALRMWQQQQREQQKQQQEEAAAAKERARKEKKRGCVIM